MRTTLEQVGPVQSTVSRASLAHLQPRVYTRYATQPVEPVAHAGKAVRRRTAAEHALRLRRHTGLVGATTAHAQADAPVLLRRV